MQMIRLTSDILDYGIYFRFLQRDEPIMMQYATGL